MSDPAAVCAIYRFRPDVTDATVANLLSRHRSVLERCGLVTDTRPTVLRSLGGAPHRDFIEIFEWKTSDSMGAAHSTAEVREIWVEIESLTTQPGVALKDLAEADRPFAHFAPFSVAYAQPAGAATAPGQARATRRARKAKPAPARKPARKVAPARAKATSKPAARKAKRPARKKR